MNDEGWIKIYRKLRKSVLRNNDTLMHVFVNFLIDANWEKRQLRNGSWIDRGELVIGQDKYAAELGITRQKLRTCITQLTSCDMITSKSTNAGTHIRIVNYSVYQTRDVNSQPANQPTANQPLTNEQPTSNQPLTTEEELQELQEGKNRRIKEGALTVNESELIDAWNKTHGTIPYRGLMLDGICRQNLVECITQSTSWVEDFYESLKRFPLNGYRDGQPMPFDSVVKLGTVRKILQGNYTVETLAERNARVAEEWLKNNS